MGEKIQNQNVMVNGLGLKQYHINELIPQIEASEFLGLDPDNRNSLYYWKRRIDPKAIFPKKGRNVMWPVRFLVKILKERNAK